MARIRTIKPQFWQDEDLSNVSESACLLAIALLNYADDEGYFNSNIMLIKSACFPLRELSVNVPGALSELYMIGYIVIGKGADGKIYGKIKNFTENQVINRPQKSKISNIQVVWFTHEQFTEYSLNHHGAFTRERKGKEGNKEVVVVVEGSENSTTPTPPSINPLSMVELMTIDQCCQTYLSHPELKETRYNIKFAHNIKCDDSLKNVLERFKDHNIGTGQLTNNLKDFMKHFKFWLDKAPKEVITPPPPPPPQQSRRFDL